MRKTVAFSAALAVAAILHAAASPASVQAPPAQAGAPRRAPPFYLELLAGPTLGLDRALRGGAAALGAGFAPPRLGGLGLGARAEAAYDASLRAFVGRAELLLALGPGLALGLGGELPLGELSLREPRSGCGIRLEPAALPSRFSLEALVAELKPRAAGRPRAGLSAELAWSAYRALGVEPEGEGALPSLAGLLSAESGFAAGLSCALRLRLAWGPAF